MTGKKKKEKESSLSHQRKREVRVREKREREKLSSSSFKFLHLSFPLSFFISLLLVSPRSRETERRKKPPSPAFVEKKPDFFSNGKCISLHGKTTGEEGKGRRANETVFCLSLVDPRLSLLFLFQLSLPSSSLRISIKEAAAALQLVERHDVDRLDVVALAVPDELLCFWFFARRVGGKKKRKR